MMPTSSRLAPTIERSLEMHRNNALLAAGLALLAIVGVAVMAKDPHREEVGLVSPKKWKERYPGR